MSTWDGHGAFPETSFYIDPDKCIDCQAWRPVWPWEAPLRDTAVPAVLADDIALNASIVE
ncbi:MAG: hypothetical protein ACRD0V_01835 [Acidimicrobiales bacterium]